MYNNRTHNIKNYQCWVFDLDGTLIDSWHDLGSSVNYLRQELDLETWPHARIYQNIGWGVKYLLKNSVPEYQDQIGMLHERFKVIYGDHLLDKTDFYQGIRPILETLKSRGKTLAVLTNKPALFTHKILDGLNASHYFQDIICGDTLETKKPDPAGLKYIAQKNCTGKNIVMVGDTQVDLDTAQAFGCQAIILGENKKFNGSYWSYNSAQDLLSDLKD